MGRIITEIINGELIKTRYDSEGSVIPDKITQDRKVVALIKGSLDSDSDRESGVEVSPDKLAVSREEFLIKLLSQSESCADRYLKFGKGLYSEKDMKKGITWAEVAYLVHYVGGLPESIEWGTIKPRNIDRVCVVHEVINDGNGGTGVSKVLDEKLASYKSRLEMENYISSIISGKRYIPLPMYCCFVDLMHNDDIETDLNLNMMFKKLSKSEFELLF